MNESDRECEVHDGFCYTHQAWLNHPGEAEAHAAEVYEDSDAAHEARLDADLGPAGWVVDGGQRAYEDERRYEDRYEDDSLLDTTRKETR